jgi:hypothetical protein
MHQPSFLALALQAADSDNQMLIVIIAVLVILFFIVVIVVIGLTIFFISRKRKKAQVESALSAVSVPSPAAYAPMPPVEPVPESLPFEAPTYSEPLPAEPESENMPVPSSPDVAVPPAVEELEFDPTRTVAIVREEEAVTIDYGSIRFTSGVLAGERFPVDPEGVYIGRESSLAQIVVSDPRISKRHLWIGVRDGQVMIVDEGSRNGTFVNDPKSARVTEAKLNSGDTVIMGESDVARFEYNT